MKYFANRYLYSIGQICQNDALLMAYVNRFNGL